jgi:hypothetical protein
MLHGQSDISVKNCRRLLSLSSSAIPEVAIMASLVYEVAKVAPHRRKRLSILRKRCPNLIARLVFYGLIDECLFGYDELDPELLSLLELEPHDPSLHAPAPECTW